MLTFQKQFIPFWPEMKQHSRSRAKKLNRNKTKEIVAKSKKVKSLIRGTADVENQLFIPDFFFFLHFLASNWKWERQTPTFVRSFLIFWITKKEIETESQIWCKRFTKICYLRFHSFHFPTLWFIKFLN